MLESTNSKKTKKKERANSLVPEQQCNVHTQDLQSQSNDMWHPAVAEESGGYTEIYALHDNARHQHNINEESEEIGAISMSTGTSTPTGRMLFDSVV